MRKNIYILPTDKPSHLFIIDKSKMFISEEPYLSFSTVGGRVHKIEGSELYQPQNMYITSDEEIKDDYVYYENGDLKGIHKVVNGQRPKTMILKKIILTTDPELINDGVQAIDNEFLEWFVDNPKHDYVTIRKKRNNLGYGISFNHQRNSLYADLVNLPITKEPKKECTCENPNDNTCDHCDAEESKRIIEKAKQQANKQGQLKEYLFIPVKDQNGIPKDKFLKIRKNGPIHKKIINLCGNDNIHIVESNQ